MKNFWRRMAAREGFTLVELVVVIAILAILAAVAYPAYTGYIGKANESADLMQLDSIKTAAQGTAASDSEKYGELSKITVTVSSKKITKITINEKEVQTDPTFTALLGTNLTTFEFKSAKYTTGDSKTATGCTIEWENSEWTAKPVTAG